MFLEKIDRNIRGVIKADQTSEEDVYQELKEYVVTYELHEHFAKFYNHYIQSLNEPTDKVGVWISGFFGSGKSHFLKILSYLLENKRVKGKCPVDFFQDKIQDEAIYEKMRQAAQIPAETILFNIDSKSPIGAKAKEDAILQVLLKVFHEHQGYYGDNLAVAELEKYLDENGYYEKFKEKFLKVAKEPWESRRHSFYFDSHYIETALLQATPMTKEAIQNWLQHGANQIEVSIEKFAHEVNDYLDQKDPNFRLIFFIDEIGQYIGDRRDLMLNLQTVAENLGTICKGRAWIVVTSQESIDSIVKVKGDDFSRIQGRFDTRLSLSSISVDEVIQKRILEKHSYVSDRLKAIYVEKGPILKNVIHFTADTRADLMGYQNEEQFAKIYPFVPYQFHLLQSVFEQVRKHGSSGKHLSEGERSMLSAFREAGMQFMDEEEGTLIPFYAFYDTIREFLQPSITRVIERAKRNPKLNDDPFHVNLLKVLFMIKYVEEIPANIDNLATLMVSHMDENKLALKEKLQQSLRKLLSQMLIQQHGEQYIFLTDDEQDVNREIAQITIEEDIMKRELYTYIFQDMYHVNRYRYSEVYDFPFNQKMDEKSYGRQIGKIGIHILSPLSIHYHQSEQDLMMLSSGTHEIVLRLGGSTAYIEEIEEALKIEEYRKRKRIAELPENVQTIIQNKKFEIRERRDRARGFLEEAIKEGSFYIHGRLVQVKGSTVKDKLNEALKLQVETTFSQLSKVDTFLEDEEELRAIIRAAEETTILDADKLSTPNQLAKDEIEDFISLENQMAKQITLKTLVDRFTNSPYGFRTIDLSHMIYVLLLEQKIRIRYQGKYLEPKEDGELLFNLFTKPIEHAKAIVTIRKKIDQRLKNRVRRLAQDLFHIRDIATDEDGLIRDLRRLIDEKETEIRSYLTYYETKPYPGRAILDRGLELFASFDQSMDPLTFFNTFLEKEKAFIDWFQLYRYLDSFFHTNQKPIYEEGLDVMEMYEDIRGYIEDEAVHEAMDQLDQILNYDEPFSTIKDIPPLVHMFKEGFKKLLEEKRKAAQEKITTDYDEVSLRANDEGVSEETKKAIDKAYERLFEQLKTFTDVYRIDAMIAQSSTLKTNYLTKMNAEIHAYDTKSTQKEGRAEEVTQKERVRLSDLVEVDRLKTEEDVDKYVLTLARKLKDIIRTNKEIDITK